MVEVYLRGREGGEYSTSGKGSRHPHAHKHTHFTHHLLPLASVQKTHNPPSTVLGHRQVSNSHPPPTRTLITTNNYYAQPTHTCNTHPTTPHSNITCFRSARNYTALGLVMMSITSNILSSNKNGPPVNGMIDGRSAR